jgi:hypothetical protein
MEINRSGLSRMTSSASLVNGSTSGALNVASILAFAAFASSMTRSTGDMLSWGPKAPIFCGGPE